MNQKEHHSFEDIEHRLREELIRRSLRPGNRLPGERELAETLGIGRAALRPALESLEKAGIVERRAQSGTFLCVPVTPLARRARVVVLAPFTGAGTNIACETDALWLHRVASAFERTIVPSRVQLVITDQTPFAHDRCSIKALSRQATTEGAQAVVMLHPLGTRSVISHALALLHDAGVHPLIVSSRTYPGLASHVYFDSRWGAYRATRYLLDRGHLQIGFAGAARGHEWCQERTQGWRDALDAAEIDDTYRWIHYPADPPDSERASAASDGEEALDAWLATESNSRPTAIVAANDVVALGLMARAAERGIAIPGDLSVIGFDNDPAALLNGLTTVERPAEALGEAAARTILERLAAGSEAATVTHRLRPVIVERSTVGAPQPSASSIENSEEIEL